MTEDEMNEEVVSLIKKINNAWLDKDTEKLKSCFTDSFSILTTEEQLLCDNRDDAVKSYIDFVTRCEVTEFIDSGYNPQASDDVAMCDYDYQITWKDGDQVLTAKGSEMFFLTRKDGDWKAFLRLITVPDEEGENSETPMA
ncbi:MAG: nuclear transport factor 2 family protein [Ignavibacteriaceae bacterium]|nr:nuclear transport factor 2 family protein [Ignavibacteriaceae bacterium]